MKHTEPVIISYIRPEGAEQIMAVVETEEFDHKPDMLTVFSWWLWNGLPCKQWFEAIGTEQILSCSIERIAKARWKRKIYRAKIL